MSEVRSVFKQTHADLHTLRNPGPPSCSGGLDVVGHLFRALTRFRFLLVVTNYCTKWVEAVSPSDVTEQQIVKFLWQNIVCHFGLPPTIISDNGTNFPSKQVANFCSKYKITHRVSTPYYPQGIGQAEISNRTILDSLYKSLNKAKASGWRNSPECYGRTALPSASRRVRLLSY